MYYDNILIQPYFMLQQSGLTCAIFIIVVTAVIVFVVVVFVVLLLLLWFVSLM